MNIEANRIPNLAQRHEKEHYVAAAAKTTIRYKRSREHAREESKSMQEKRARVAEAAQRTIRYKRACKRREQEDGRAGRWQSF